jgi:hypothetical protein
MKTKATGVVSLKKYLLKQDEKNEAILLRRLSEKAKLEYMTLMASKWIGLEIETEIVEQIGCILNPESEHKLFEMGRLAAQISFTGIYKMFMRIKLPVSILKRAQSIWNIYYDQGTAEVDVKEGHAILRVTEARELTSEQCEEICGFIQGGMELTEAKHIRVN